MFGRLFGSTPKKQESSSSDERRVALIAAVRKHSKEDPLIGAKLGGREVLRELLEALNDEKGVHVETLLTVSGALAGYACQASLRAQAAANGLPGNASFHTVQTTDGKQYFFGDQLNAVLAESPHSVWHIVAGAAQHAGATELPDLNDMFRHTAAVLGDDGFGVPRLPEVHRPRQLPVVYLKAMWPAVFPTVKAFCPSPADWPIVLGVAIQEAIMLGKGAIEPGLAARIVMESAVPMSKIDLPNA